MENSTQNSSQFIATKIIQILQQKKQLTKIKTLKIYVVLTVKV